jgi:hypothetical protein
LSLTERLEFDTLFQENMIRHYPGMTWAEMRQWDQFARAYCRVPYAPRYAGVGKPKPYGPDPEEGPIDPNFEVKAGPPVPPPAAPVKHVVPVPPPSRPSRGSPPLPQAKRKNLLQAFLSFLRKQNWKFKLKQFCHRLLNFHQSHLHQFQM